jgi:hypothetical protein
MGLYFELSDAVCLMPSHLDHLHDAGGDLSEAPAAGFAAGQDGLDILSDDARGALGTGTMFSPSLWPVTAAVIKHP